MSKFSRCATAKGAVVTGAVLAALAIAGPASAHVTISPGASPKGGSDVELTFRVPTEKAQATTTQVEVDFPTDKPITGVLPEPTPGWTVKVDDLTLPAPIKTDDGTVTQVVQRITWSGGQIPAGQYQGFRVMLGSLPDDASSLTFKALQTYSDGDVVRWIDVQQPGQPEPDHPAPVLTLTAAAPDGAPSAPAPASSGTALATATAPAPATATATATVTAVSSTVASSKTTDSTARALGIAGVVIGVLGLGAGAFGFVAVRRKGAGTPE